MSHKAPDRIHRRPREETREQDLSNLFAELATKGLIQPCLQHSDCASAMAKDR